MEGWIRETSADYTHITALIEKATQDTVLTFAGLVPIRLLRLVPKERQREA